MSAIINLGSALIDRGELEEAEALYRKALDIAPEDPGVHSALGKLAAMRGDMQAARSHVERALELDPLQAEMHYVLAQLLRRQGRSADAVASFLRALELAPHRPDIVFDLAVTYAQKGDYGSSWKYVHQADRLGWTTPPDFEAALRAQMPDPGAR